MYTTTNSPALIEQEIYGTTIQTSLDETLLPSVMFMDVTGQFSTGEQFNMPVLGDVIVEELEEDTGFVYNPLESGRVQLQITDHVGTAWYVTDKFRQDSYLVDQAIATHSQKAAQGIKEKYETSFLATGARYFETSTGDDAINGQPHKIVSAETNGVFIYEHLIQAGLALDVAKVPQAGRVFIASPVVAATMASLVNLSTDITEFAKEVFTMGVRDEFRIRFNMNGFDVMISNLLHVADFNDGTTSITGGVCNLAMSVLDDNLKPIFGAWRQPVQVEYERDADKRRDKFTASARWGFGVKRVDTMVAIVTNKDNYK